MTSNLNNRVTRYPINQEDKTMENNTTMNLTQAIEFTKAVGDQVTALVVGDKGFGKTSALKELGKAFPSHHLAYFDCTTKDVGDMLIPKIKSQSEVDYVSFAPNEEFGLHTGKPIILMLDEIGKANTSVKNALMRIMLERQIGGYKLPEGSIVFATTNKANEGIGDLLQDHHRDRVVVINLRKPTNEEWIDWAVSNAIHPSVLGFAKEFPQIFQAHEEVKEANDNPYIYHPNLPRECFVTGRSLEMASIVITRCEEHNIPKDVTKKALGGTIGKRGAFDLWAFIELADKMPRRADIIAKPKETIVPDNPSIKAMVVFNALASMSKEFVTPWFDYFIRLDKEFQAMFIKGVMPAKYHARELVFKHPKFGEWARENNYMFQADKV